MKAGTTIHTTDIDLILHACHYLGEMETVGGRNGRRVGRVFGRMKEWMLECF
jgi:hypothetical protein